MTSAQPTSIITTSISSTHMSFWPFEQSCLVMKPFWPVKVIGCPSHCCCITANYEFISIAYLTAAQLLHSNTGCQRIPRLNSALPLIPENYSVTASMESDGSHGSLALKKPTNITIFTKPMGKYNSKLRFNYLLPAGILI